MKFLFKSLTFLLNYKKIRKLPWTKNLKYTKIFNIIGLIYKIFNLKIIKIFIYTMKSLLLIQAILFGIYAWNFDITLYSIQFSFEYLKNFYLKILILVRD
jgi:hypothetical protein